MREAEVAEAVQRLRAIGTDDSTIEAKASGQALPRSVKETLSAFANTRGGLLVLGIDEGSGFVATGVDDPGKIAADLASLARNDMQPPLDIAVDIVPFEDVYLVVAEVPEILPSDKPCYPKAGGIRASYKRYADGDYRMTDFEVQMLLESRGHPRHDEEPVDGAALVDLDADLVSSFLGRLRATRRSSFGGISDEDALRRLNVLVPSSTVDALVPSVGGILALGRYPQQFFPQLNVTFVVYPTVTGEPLTDGTRFLHNGAYDGPIPAMVADTMGMITRMMSSRAVVDGSGRGQILEYPSIAVREALVNALVHRDLSHHSRGTQVQVEMYPDRLVIRSPGGLFGPVAVEELGEEGISSSRNAALLKILEDVTIPSTERTVCENRGSGIRAMIQALTAAGMSPPDFHASFSRFRVTFPNHTLIGEETLAWIRNLGQRGLTDTQVMGLAMLQEGRHLTNSLYRSVTNIDSRHATAELQDLVARGLAEQSGDRRWAQYRLSPALDAAQSRPRQLSLNPPDSDRSEADGVNGREVRGDRREDILALLKDQTLTRKDLEEALGLSAKGVLYWLDVLRGEGKVEMVGKPRSRFVRYQAVAPPSGDG